MTNCEVNGVGLKVIMGCLDHKGRGGGGVVRGQGVQIEGTDLK